LSDSGSLTVVVVLAAAGSLTVAVLKRPRF